MLEVDLVATGLVVIENVALDNPPGTVTEAGTVATEVVSDVRFTVAPAAGAVVFNVAVAVAEVPPTTLLGLIVIDDKNMTTVFGTNITSADVDVVP